MIVDTHPHILAGDDSRYPVDPIGGVQSAWSKGVRFGAHDLIALMDDAGVAGATVVQASTVYGDDNTLVADGVAAFPARLAGVGGIDPRTPDARERLAYWVRERKLTGMRVFAGGSTIAGSDWIADAALDPFWDDVTALAIPLNLQIRFGDIERAASIFRRHPAMTVILDNLAVAPLQGGPPYAAAQALFALAAHPNVYLKLTHSNLTKAADGGDPRDLLVALAAQFGAGRMMWGSNYPNERPAGDAPYRSLVEAAQSAVERCAPAEREEILGGTAARLYGLTTLG
jgi:predicted TIM-barrel fold metal-dependent hydrolase